MKKLALIMAVLAVAGLAATAQATPTVSTGGDGLELRVFVTNLGGGQWEYQYDLMTNYARGYEWYTPFNLQFDFNDGGASTVEDNFLNLYNAGTRMELRELWTAGGIAGNNTWGLTAGVHASYGDYVTNSWIVLPTVPQADAENWIVDPVYATAEGFANPFHLPRDYMMEWENPLANTAPEYYTDRYNIMNIHSGVPFDADSDGVRDDLNLGWSGDGAISAGPYWGPGMTYPMDGFDDSWQLGATIRIVSDLGPNGTVILEHYTGGTKWTSPIVAPGVPEPATMSLLALGGIAALIRRRK